jgi:DedD protein
MDRALKERIVGAAILVVFIVLVVPVFLDGPAEDPAVVSESVTLPGQNSQQRTRQTIVLERDRKEPVPASQASATPPGSAADETSKSPRPVVTTPQAAAAKAPEPEPQKVAEKAPEQASPTVAEKAPPTATEQAPPAASQVATAAPASTTGMWAVQLGSFSRKDNADRLAAELRGKGFAAFISQVSTSGTALHRVRIGPQKDRDSAEAVAVQLEKAGVKGQVVPHP